MKSPPLIQRLIPILHEDASFLAVDKPAGVDVGGLPHETTAGLTELVAALHGRNETLHPGNRPSRFESGVLLFGKDSAAAVRIRTALKSFRLEREYVAVVNGRMKTPTMAVAADRGLSEEKVQKGGRGVGRARGGMAPLTPLPPPSAPSFDRLDCASWGTVFTTDPHARRRMKIPVYTLPACGCNCPAKRS